MTETKESINCKVCFYVILASILFLIVLSAHIWMTIQKVRSGHGLDAFYIIFFSPRFGMTYLSALIYYIIFAIVILLMPLINWLSKKEERSFKKKYHIND